MPIDNNIEEHLPHHSDFFNNETFPVRDYHIRMNPGIQIHIDRGNHDGDGNHGQIGHNDDDGHERIRRYSEDPDDDGNDDYSILEVHNVAADLLSEDEGDDESEDYEHDHIGNSDDYDNYREEEIGFESGDDNDESYW